MSDALDDAPPTLGPLREAWEAMAAHDPLWAVLSREDKEGARWDSSEFRRTGEEQIRGMLHLLGERGIGFAPGRALDFGCGVGRLALPLLPHFRRVVGVDLARPMLQEARRNAGDRPLDLVLSCSASLPFADGSFDFALCHLVLMHVPLAVVPAYLAELCRILKPDGIGLVTMPTALNGSREAVTLGREVETGAGRVWQHMSALPEGDVRAVLERSGAAVELFLADGNPAEREFGAYVFRRRRTSGAPPPPSAAPEGG